MPNRFRNLTDAQLLGTLRVLADTLQAQGEEYGLSPGEIAALNEATETFRSDTLEATLAEARRRAATERKRASREIAVERISNAAQKIYANLNVSNTMLADAGLAVRPDRGHRQTPKTPVDFIAIPDALGQIQFKWDRSGNSQHTIFVIQQRQGNRWENIALTTKTKLTVPDFPVGVEATFRVIAQINQRQSVPGPISIVWPNAQRAEAA